MKLRRLEISRLPGIGEGFAVEGVDPGVNLVTGPNAVGKSSLLRALRYLVAPQPASDPPGLVLSAEFLSVEGAWRVERTASAIRWELEGRESQAPPLPAPDELDCYWLPMEALMDAGASDEALLAQLQRTLAGGYDFHALQELPRFRCGPKHGQGTARRLREAERARREVENHYRKLHDEEGRLPELERRRSEAEAAAKRLGDLRKGLEWLHARRERRRLESLLREFPRGMESLRGDELERLKRLEAEREACRREENELLHAIEAARGTVAETGLADGKPSPEAAAAAAESLREAGLVRVKREEALRRWEKEAARLLAARHDLGNEDPDRGLEIRPETVSEAERLAEAYRESAARAREFEGRLRDLPEAPCQERTRRLGDAVDQLRYWCLDRDEALRNLRVAAWTGLGAFLAAAGAAFWLEEYWAGGAAVLAAVSALALWFALRPLGARRVARKLEEWGIESPADWERGTVGEHFRNLEERYHSMLQDGLRAAAAPDFRRRLAEAENDRDQASSRIDGWKASFAWDPGLTEGGLAHFIRVAREHRIALANEAAERAECERLEREQSERERQVVEFLEGWGGEAFAGLPAKALQKAFEAFAGKLRSAEAAERQAAEAERGLARVRRRGGELEREAVELYRAAGAGEGDRPGLLERCRRHEEWSDLDRERNEQRVLESSHANSLEADSEISERVEADDETWLRERIAEAEGEAEKAGDLRDEITGIRTRVAEAGKDGRLDRTRAEEDGWRAQLHDERADALFAETAAFWMDAVREQYRHDHEPELLTDARELFGRFTHREFELEAGDGSRFFARDLRQGGERSLRELSTATRMQLLLAARLAWVRSLEKQREPFPLILDEALTTSDDRRFGQVAASIDEACREEGRQMFYLTARPYEARLWRESTGRAPHLIDLESVRFDRGGAEPVDFQMDPVPEIPSPDGSSPEEYAARIGVPAIDPDRSAEGIHVFHLLRDDLAALAELLREWRVSRLGQLEALLGDKNAARRIARGDTLGLRCRLARYWVEVWREGRGRPVDRIALEESGAVSDRFIDKVGDLAGELGGDGRRLLDALRRRQVGGFRNQSIASLEEWMAERGHLDGRPQLDAEGRRARALAEFASICAPQEAGSVVDWLEAGVGKSG